MAAAQKRKRAHSILAVMLVVSVGSLALAGALMLMTANRTLAGLESYLYEKEFEETASAVNVLNRDIEILHAQMYSQLSGSKLKKSLIFMYDNLMNTQYQESITTVRTQLFNMEMALDLAENMTIYVPLYRRMVTSVSSSTYTWDVGQWLKKITAATLPDVFVHEGQLIFALSDTMGAARYAENRLLIMSKVQRYVMAHYLNRFTQESNPSPFLLFVEEGGNVTLFASSSPERPLLGETEPLISLIARASEGAEIYTEGGEHYLITWKASAIPALKICQLTSMALMEERLGVQRVPIILGYTLALLIIVTLICLMYLLIQRPIRRMKRALERVGKGDFSTRIDTDATWSAEFQQMYGQFNSMAAHTQRLIEQEYELRLLNTMAELKQMQYQISPHFLYNTYFFLRATLYDEEYEQAEQMADLMGRFLRYITTSSQNEATLGEEIDHALAYLKIQQLRFHNRANDNVQDCPAALLKRQVPRLILQPLIENAFEHGIKRLGEEGVVLVHIGWGDGALTLTVEDNGGEITDGQIALVQSALEGGGTQYINNGIALANIHKRLKILYQDRGTLSVSRSALGGFRSVISIKWGDASV